MEELPDDLVQTELPFKDEIRAYAYTQPDYEECLKRLLGGLGVKDPEIFIKAHPHPWCYYTYGLVLKG